MKKSVIICMVFLLGGTSAFTVKGQGQTTANTAVTTMSADAKAKSDADQEKKAAEWVKSLNLADAQKEARLQQVIATHLKFIRDWHNEHPPSTVPRRSPSSRVPVSRAPTTRSSRSPTSSPPRSDTRCAARSTSSTTTPSTSA